jgi:outer membrane protein insertion porin family
MRIPLLALLFILQAWLVNERLYGSTVKHLQQSSTAAIYFEGNRKVSDIQLLNAMILPRMTGTVSRVIPKNLFTPELLRTDLNRIHQYLKEHGYLNPTIGEPKIERIGDNLKITIHVKEGILYRVGEVKTEGFKIFGPGIILSKADIKKGDYIKNEKPFEYAIDEVKKEYYKRGFLQVQIKVSQQIQMVSSESEEAVVNYKITVDEGVLYYIRRVEFVGNSITRDQILRRNILMNEGDAYNEELLEKTLKRLNRLGIFEKITREDVKFSFDEENHLVDILFKIKEKRRQV